VGESLNFPGTANSIGFTAPDPLFPLVAPVAGNHYVDHGPGCPNCGKYINGIAPNYALWPAYGYDPDNPPQASDAFIVKFRADGSGLIYSSFIGGSGDEVIHGIVHSTRAGKHGIYISGLTGSQDTRPTDPVAQPGEEPPPPPWPTPWYVFPVTGTGTGTLPGTATAPTGLGDPPFQPVHGVTRTTYCHVPPALRQDETGDWPCSPEPSDPNEDTFIMRLDDAPDELPAPPVTGGATEDHPFVITATPKTVVVEKNGSGIFNIDVLADIGFGGTVALTQKYEPIDAHLTITPALDSCTLPGGTVSPNVCGPRTFTVSADALASGTYTITVTGTVGVGRVEGDRGGVEPRRAQLGWHVAALPQRSGARRWRRCVAR
jgi:hypothetical protein